MDDGIGYFDGLLRRLASDDSAKIDLYNRGIDDAECKRLVLILKNKPTMRHLSLYSNRIGPEGTRVLTDLLVPGTMLVRLSLNRNHIGDDGAEILGATIPHCCLTVLELTGNNIGHKGMEHLATGFAENTTIEKLDLRSNRIGNRRAVEAVSKLLGTNSSLKWLFLWGNAAVSINSNTDHHEALMNGVRQRCLQENNALKGVCVGHIGLQRQINAYLKWDRLGKLQLRTESMATALWTHYFAKVGSEANLVYNMVRAKPDLFRPSHLIGQKRPCISENENDEEATSPCDVHDRKRRRIE